MINQPCQCTIEEQKICSLTVNTVRDYGYAAIPDKYLYMRVRIIACVKGFHAQVADDMANIKRPKNAKKSSTKVLTNHSFIVKL